MPSVLRTSVSPSMSCEAHRIMTERGLCDSLVAPTDEVVADNEEVLIREDVDVEVEPVYGEQKSKIKLASYIPRVSWLLIRLFVKRMVQKYLIREFHPLVLFYAFSFFNGFGLALPLLIRFFYLYAQQGVAPSTTLILLTFSTSMAMFSLFFGMWLDMEDNRKLIAQPRARQGSA